MNQKVQTSADFSPNVSQLKEEEEGLALVGTGVKEMVLKHYSKQAGAHLWLEKGINKERVIKGAREEEHIYGINVSKETEMGPNQCFWKH